MTIWLHRALIWVFKTDSGKVKIASKVEGKISVHHCSLLHAQHRNQCYLLFYWHSALIKTKVVILTSFVAHWRAPEAGRRNVWSLLGAAKYCRVAKLRPHWRCDLIDKFCQSLRLIKTVLSLVRIGPKSHSSPQIRNAFNQNLFILLLTCFNIFRIIVFLACKHLVVFYLSLKVAINFSCLRNFPEPNLPSIFLWSSSFTFGNFHISTPLVLLLVPHQTRNNYLLTWRSSIN